MQTNLVLPSSFVSVGTTTRNFFVDRSAPRGVRVAYQVVAENATGAMSPRSNVQVVPDPRPAATFGQLERALGGSAQAVAAAAGAESRPGDRSGELRILARLVRARHVDPDVSELAYRLERRIRYAGIAGGP
jgi:hypothetical protein